MKKIIFQTVIAHATIVLALCFAVLLILDSFNPYMEFISSSQSKKLLVLFCIFAFFNGVGSAIHVYGIHKKKYQKQRNDDKTS